VSFKQGIWVLMLVLLLCSAITDPTKTKQALKKAWVSFVNILPQFSGVVVLISITLALVTPKLIGKFVGRDTGIFGMLLSSIIGAVTLIPGFIAFPLAKTLVDLGAGVPQIAILVSTLMMVGTVTIPVESHYFGKKVTLLRNGLAYLASFVVALIMGVIIR